MFTLAAFAEDQDSGGSEVQVSALADDHLFVSGDNLRVPKLNELLAVIGGIASGGNSYMRLETPSLRDVNRLYVKPLNGLADSDVEPSDPIAVMDLTRSPRVLTVDEQMTCTIHSDSSAAAFQWSLVCFGEGPPRPTSGQIIPVRATGSTTVTARAWTTVTLTFPDVLPRGRYQVCGLRAYGATMIAARFVFKPGTWRPGAPGVDSHTTMDYPLFRMGRLGVWGEFEDTTPPDIEVLCDVADTAQEFTIDLIPLF